VNKGGDVMDFENFGDMDIFELAFSLGMAETIAEEELERLLIEREVDKEDDDNLADEW